MDEISSEKYGIFQDILLCLFVFSAFFSLHHSLWPTKSKNLPLEKRQKDQKYKLEVLRKVGKKKYKKKTYQVTGNQYEVEIAKTGKYRWRVRPFSERQPASTQVLHMEEFVVRIDTRVPPPEELSLLHTGDWTQRFFLWNKVEGAQRDLYQVYDVKRNKITRNNDTWSNFADRIAHRGDYYTGWLDEGKDRYFFAKVASIDKNGVIGPFSDCIMTYVGSSSKQPKAPNPAHYSFCGGRAQALSLVIMTSPMPEMTLQPLCSPHFGGLIG